MALPVFFLVSYVPYDLDIYLKIFCIELNMPLSCTTYKTLVANVKN